MRTALKAALLVAVTMLVLGAVGTAVAGEQAAIQIEGSTTVGPIADAFVEAFASSHPNVTMTVKKTGSGDGAAALIDGRCQIATMSRFMKPEEFAKAVANGVMPVAHAVAMDGVCVIVHPSNPVKDLTTAQVHGIYTGKLTNWSQLGGPDLPIVAVSRDTSSGTYESFTHFVMGTDKMAQQVEYVNSNPQCHARVAATPAAVAYAGLGFVDEKVKALQVNAVAPSRQTIATGKYPMSRPLFLFTNGYPQLGTPIFDFCTFHLTEKGQEIIEAKGFVPLTAY